MVDKTATAAGRKFESDIVKYLRANEFKAERLHLSGRFDEGDLWFEGAEYMVPTGDRTIDLRERLVVVEAKRTKAFTPAQWVAEAQAEAANFAKARGLGPEDAPFWGVVAARRNHGIKDAYVITTMSEWLRQVG